MEAPLECLLAALVWQMRHWVRGLCAFFSSPLRPPQVLKPLIPLNSIPVSYCIVDVTTYPPLTIYIRLKSRATMVPVNHISGASIVAAGCTTSPHFLKFRSATERVRAEGDARRSQMGFIIKSKLRSRFFRDGTRRYPTVRVSTSELLVIRFVLCAGGIVLTNHHPERTTGEGTG